MLKKLDRVILALMLLAAAVYLLWYRPNEAHNRRLARAAGEVVTKFGGHIGSIQAPFSPWSEYCITFPDKPFTRSDLEQFTPIAALAEDSHVYLGFDGDLADDDLDYLRKLIPKVNLWTKRDRDARAAATD